MTTATRTRRCLTRALVPALLTAATFAGATATAVTADAAALQRASATVSSKVTVTAQRTAAATMQATAEATVPGSSIAPVRATMSASATRTVSSEASSVGRRTATASASTKSRAKARATTLARKAARAAARATASALAADSAKTKAQAAAVAAARAEAIKLAKAKAAELARAKAAASGAVPTTPAPVPTTGVVNVAPVAAPCGGAAAPVSDGRTMTCTFNDEFNTATLDTTKWSAVTTATSGYRNNPAECTVDSPQTIEQSNGTLKLSTRPAPGYRCSDGTTSFISGSVSSIGKFSQTYGTYSIRAKFPAATVAGLHSALWMWPNDQSKYVSWPMSGELDIAERYSKYPDRTIPYLHYVYDPTTTALQSLTGSWADGYSMTGTNIDTNNYCIQPDPDAFHTYTMSWKPGQISIDFDGKNCLTNNYSASGLPSGAPFDQPFFMILTQALGAAGTANEPTAATPTTATTEIDYVRVWK